MKIWVVALALSMVLANLAEAFLRDLDPLIVKVDETRRVHVSVSGMPNSAAYTARIDPSEENLSLIDAEKGDDFSVRNGVKTVFLSWKDDKYLRIMEIVLGESPKVTDGTLFSFQFQTENAGEAKIWLRLRNYNADSLRYSQFAEHFYVYVTIENPQYDVNNDGVIDSQDLHALNTARIEDDPNPRLRYLGEAEGITVRCLIILSRQIEVALLAPSVEMPNLPTQLLANYPNPFNPETWIPYQLSEAADITINIFSSAGESIHTVDLGYQMAGDYTNKGRAYRWNGRDRFGEMVSGGVYFYQLQAGDYSSVRKMLILK